MGLSPHLGTSRALSDLGAWAVGRELRPPVHFSLEHLVASIASASLVSFEQGGAFKADEPHVLK
jgi:hypothetical protein